MRFLGASCCLALGLALISCATPGGTYVRAEEYFSIATAYFDLEKYSEAERWFLLARKTKKTELASEYYLGRIDFMLGDYETSAVRFEKLMKHDQNNTTVIRAAAYSWLKAKQWDKSLALFGRLENLLPETEDARFNYALALASSGRLEEAVEKIKPYVERNPSDRESLLLLARTEKKLSRPEAINHISAALALKEENPVRLELAEVFESRELYARAIESYQMLISSEEAMTGELKKADLRFRKARVMLLAGEDALKALEEIRAVLAEGFNDSTLLTQLSQDPRLSEELRLSLSEIVQEFDRTLAPEGTNEQ